MPYNPGITYDSGALARGLEQFSEGLAQGLQEYRQNKQEGQALEAVGEMIWKQRQQSGLPPIDPKVLSQFSKGGTSTKRAIIGQLAAETMLGIQEREAKSLRESRALQDSERAQRMLALQNAQQAQRGFNAQWSAYLNTPQTIRRPDKGEVLLQLAAQNNLPPGAIDSRFLGQFEPRPLPLGQTMDIPHLGTLIGTGGAPRFEAARTRPQLFPAKDPVTGKPIPGMALTESGGAIQTGERGGLKDLSQTEVDRITALNQAASDLQTLEGLYNALDPDYGGPIMGRLRSAAGGVTGDNATIVALQNAITAATPNLARGVFREVGVLTDEDITRYKELLPSPTDSSGARKTKFDQLRKRIQQGQTETMEQLRKAGRDVGGFDAKSGAGAAVLQKFDNEKAARAAGLKDGDMFLFYDPSTASYRKARLK